MKKYSFRTIELLRHWHSLMPKPQEAVGASILLASLILLSVLAGMNFSPDNHKLNVGDVARQDIIATGDLWIEDVHAMQTQRKMLATVSPAVFDLKKQPVDDFREKVIVILDYLNTHDVSADADAIARDLSLTYNIVLTKQDIKILARRDVNQFMLSKQLPMITDLLATGVVANKQEINHTGGVLIRGIDGDAEEVLRRDIASILDLEGIRRQAAQFMLSQSPLPKAARSVADQFYSLLLAPTLFFNAEATRHINSSLMDSVKPIYTQIQKGDILVRKGETITPDIQLKLQATSKSFIKAVHIHLAGGIFLLSLCTGIGLFVTPRGTPNRQRLRSKDYTVIAVSILVTGIVAKCIAISGDRLLDPWLAGATPYIFPTAGMVGLFSLVLGYRQIMALGMLTSLMTVILFNADLSVFLFFFFTGILNASIVRRAQSRRDILLGFPLLFVGTLALGLASAFFKGIFTAESLPYLLTFITINATLSMCVVFALSPIFEIGLHYSTRFRLMELMNMEQPLLRELMVTAPGTYHHSLVVSNMAEAGAQAIDADSLLCKVAALYHDVGKLAHPEYFIENQMDGPNKHDFLNPSMSAMILASHVKKGAELAQQFHFDGAIYDIIRQHHGTSLMRFFYNKAKSADPNVSIDDFSYPGPRPQTKEAAVVMLADVVEASSRTLSDPSTARLNTHVNSILKDVYISGQLDESNLTFKDLTGISESFVRILIGIFHHRIAYPSLAKPDQRALPRRNAEAVSLEDR